MPAPQLDTDPTAVFGRRVIAALIDAALILIPALLLITANFEYLAVDSLGEDPQAFCDAYTAQTDGLCLNLADIDDRVYFSDGVDTASTAFYWGATFLLLVVVQGLTGWTIGKLLTGIRTVRLDGRPPGIVKAFVRWILWVIDGFPYIVPLLGFIVGLTTVGHRRVGDMVANTLVVHRSAAGAPIVVAGLAAAAGQSATYAVGGAPAGDPTGSPGATGPTWDPARNTYIQWDATQGRWFQWDEAAREWTKISGS